MSDGPHRSLPLRRHWQDFAQSAAQAAFGAEEVCARLPQAVTRDVLDAPIREVQAIMSEASLFPEIRVDQLEALRGSCRGSEPAYRLIDCAIDAVRSGLAGDAGAQAALAHAIDDTVRSAFLSIEEHWHRNASAGSARFTRTRIDEARRQFDGGALARELLAPGKLPGRRSLTPPRHTGIDEGPRL
jgi:hypothetical protein